MNRLWIAGLALLTLAGCVATSADTRVDHKAELVYVGTAQALDGEVLLVQIPIQPSIQKSTCTTLNCSSPSMTWGLRIKLWNISAPSVDQLCTRPNSSGFQYCGREAQAALAELIRDQVVTCNEKLKPRKGWYAESSAECFAGGTNLNARIIELGYAFAYPHLDHPSYPGQKNPYKAYEMQAQSERRGLWTARFSIPTWEFRAQDSSIRH